MVLLSMSSMAADWQPLFNGRDLSGWTNVNCAPSTWSVREGMVVSTGIPTGVLRTLREYENFILEVEWKHLKAGGNAGLFVHSGALPVKGQPFTKAIEVQIIDRDHPEGLATSHGDVFSIQGATFTPDRPHPKGWMRCLPSERRARPAGEWNHYRVECRDGRITLAVNGKEVSGGSNCNPRKGFICLESEGSECHFRNIRIQELTPSRPPPPETPELDFISLYTGVDLSGWKTDDPGTWKANDWILESAANSSPLWLEKHYEQFSLIFDWRFPSGGGETEVYLNGETNLPVKLVARDSQWRRHTFHAPVSRGAIGLRGNGAHFANLYVKEESVRARTNSEIVAVKKIWDAAPHNAFTDLIRFNDQWFCVFREGKSHVSPDGAIQVLVSDDGNTWTSAARLTSTNSDLRDAKIALTPQNELMLTAAGALHPPAKHKHQTYVWFSKDGANWSAPAPIGEPDMWLWRVTWHEGSAYGVGYGTAGEKLARLYSSTDGQAFATLVPKFFEEGYPNESSIVFEPNNTALCLLRRDGSPATGKLGSAKPPYTNWEWKDLEVKIGGPHMLRLQDGRLVACVRLYDGTVRTSLAWIDRATGKLTEFQKLPSGGDSSYAGLVWHDDLLWVSYYSSHEGKTSIYLAKVRLPE